MPFEKVRTGASRRSHSPSIVRSRSVRSARSTQRDGKLALLASVPPFASLRSEDLLALGASRVLSKPFRSLAELTQAVWETAHST